MELRGCDCEQIDLHRDYIFAKYTKTHNHFAAAISLNAVCQTDCTNTMQHDMCKKNTWCIALIVMTIHVSWAKKSAHGVATTTRPAGSAAVCSGSEPRWKKRCTADGLAIQNAVWQSRYWYGVSACNHSYVTCVCLIATKLLCVILVGSFSCLCRPRLDMLRAQLLSLWN